MVSFDKDYYINIDGDYTTREPLGYCNCYLHRGYVTTKEFKRHDCIKKHCDHFIMNTYHLYWITEGLATVRKQYVKRLNKGYSMGAINDTDYRSLIHNWNKEFMTTYLANHVYNKEIDEKYQTKSNYVPKRIKIPKRPNIYDRVKNGIKIKMRKFAYTILGIVKKWN